MITSNWKGGKITYIQTGYIRIYRPKHPLADHQGYVKEHRLIMEEKLGRYLKRNEVIHHINGNKSDNRIENLALYDRQSEHRKNQNELINEISRLKKLLDEHGIEWRI